MADTSDTIPSPSILIVDDNEANIELAIAFLEDEGYQYDTALNGKLALEAAFSKPYDLILLDINMPEMDGFETIARLKKDGGTKDIPVIFLSALNDIESVTKAFEAGAVDYVSKPFNGLELIARVRTHVKLSQTLRELEEKQNRLAQLVAVDPVTKVANRLRFLSELRQQIKSSKRENTSFSVVALSVNKLPRYEEMYGYEAADKLLARFAAKVKGMLNDNLLFARLYGGDFMLLLPGASRAAAVSVANKTVQKIGAEKIGNTAVSCTAAVISCSPQDTDVSMLRRAEQKIKEARETGLSVIEK
jgi:diguanylate cyclase (GGDEF)-like protein